MFESEKMEREGKIRLRKTFMNRDGLEVNFFPEGIKLTVRDPHPDGHRLSWADLDDMRSWTRELTDAEPIKLSGRMTRIPIDSRSNKAKRVKRMVAIKAGKPAMTQMVTNAVRIGGGKRKIKI